LPGLTLQAPNMVHVEAPSGRGGVLLEAAVAIHGSMVGPVRFSFLGLNSALSRLRRVCWPGIVAGGGVCHSHIASAGKRMGHLGWARQATDRTPRRRVGTRPLPCIAAVIGHTGLVSAWPSTRSSRRALFFFSSFFSFALAATPSCATTMATHPRLLHDVSLLGRVHHTTPRDKTAGLGPLAMAVSLGRVHNHQPPRQHRRTRLSDSGDISLLDGSHGGLPTAPQSGACGQIASPDRVHRGRCSASLTRRPVGRPINVYHPLQRRVRSMRMWQYQVERRAWCLRTGVIRI
jgi:hypothetical protein